MKNKNDKELLRAIEKWSGHSLCSDFAVIIFYCIVAAIFIGLFISFVKAICISDFINQLFLC